ncbi:hypothetical protein PSPO01_09143 [Paraphaeosphaeria sporulosa]
MAGLWLSHLPLGLLWFSEQSFLPQNHAWRAPSWSWASLDGLIVWHSDMMTTVDPVFRILPETTEAMGLAHEGAPYGEVVSGSSYIKGRVRKGNVSSDGQDEPNAINLDRAEICWDNDSFASLASTSEIFCLLICQFEQVRQPGPSGLLMKQVNQQKYSRIGVFHFKPLQIYDLEGDEHVDIEGRVERFQRAQIAAAELFESSDPASIVLI